jgi:hypothetical protein
VRIINKETKEYQEASGLIALGKLFETLDVEPTPMQLAIINDFDNRLDQWSYMNLAASRRSGKTFTVSIIAVFELLKPFSSTIIVSKSSKSLTANFNEIIKNLRLLGIKPDKLNSNTYSLTVGSSHLRCAVHTQTENLLGARASLLLIDEAGVYPYQDFMEQSLLPMRLDYGTYENTHQFVAKVVKVSSPRTIGSDFYRDFQIGLPPILERHLHSKNDGYISNSGTISYSYNIYDSPLVTVDIIESIKKSTPEDIWKTEYLCEFIHASAVNVFPSFNKSINLYDIDKFLTKIKSIGKTEYKGFIGIDIGLIDSTAFVVGTIIENKLYVLDTFNQNLMTTDEIAKQLVTIKDKWTTHKDITLSFSEGALYIDPSAALTRFDLANDYDIENLPAFNKIKEGINDINTLFRDNLIQIPISSTELIEQIETLAYKESAVYSLSASTSGDPFLRVKGHHYDIAHAFRYLTASLKRYWNLPETTTQKD